MTIRTTSWEYDCLTYEHHHPTRPEVQPIPSQSHPSEVVFLLFWQGRGIQLSAFTTSQRRRRQPLLASKLRLTVDLSNLRWKRENMRQQLTGEGEKYHNYKMSHISFWFSGWGKSASRGRVWARVAAAEDLDPVDGGEPRHLPDQAGTPSSRSWG